MCIAQANFNSFNSRSIIDLFMHSLCVSIRPASIRIKCATYEPVCIVVLYSVCVCSETEWVWMGKRGSIGRSLHNSTGNIRPHEIVAKKHSSIVLINVALLYVLKIGKFPEKLIRWNSSHTHMHYTTKANGREWENNFHIGFKSGYYANSNHSPPTIQPHLSPHTHVVALASAHIRTFCKSGSNHHAERVDPLSAVEQASAHITFK